MSASQILNILDVKNHLFDIYFLVHGDVWDSYCSLQLLICYHPTVAMKSGLVARLQLAKCDIA